jgi:hypothetical protein
MSACATAGKTPLSFQESDRFQKKRRKSQLLRLCAGGSVTSTPKGAGNFFLFTKKKLPPCLPNGPKTCRRMQNSLATQHMFCN